MFEEIFKQSTSSVKELHIGLFLFKLVLATLLGALLAFHVSYIKDVTKSPRRWQFAKAQVLICLVGTIMIIVIGDNVARAFGLFGLGSFIRFRTQIKSPIDTALIFILIALGMAVGIGLFAPAIMVALFLYVIILVLEHIKGPVNSESGELGITKKK